MTTKSWPQPTPAQNWARSMGYTLVCLNGDVAEIFKDWLKRAFPDRAEKVLRQIESCHAGQLGDNRFGKRMRGEGKIADIIAGQFRLARKKFFAGRSLPSYNLELHRDFKSPQLKLF